MNITDMDATKLFANVTLFFSGDETVNTDASCTAVIDTSPEVDAAIIYTPCVDVGAADVTAITLDPFSIVNVVLVLYVTLFNVPVTFVLILLSNALTASVIRSTSVENTDASGLSVMAGMGIVVPVG